jgi:hypothetical protein
MKSYTKPQARFQKRSQKPAFKVTDAYNQPIPLSKDQRDALEAAIEANAPRSFLEQLIRGFNRQAVFVSKRRGEYWEEFLNLPRHSAPQNTAYKTSYTTTLGERVRIKFKQGS